MFGRLPWSKQLLSLAMRDGRHRSLAMRRMSQEASTIPRRKLSKPVSITQLATTMPRVGQLYGAMSVIAQTRPSESHKGSWLHTLGGVAGFLLFSAYLYNTVTDLVTIPHYESIETLDALGIPHLYQLEYLGSGEGVSGHHAPELYKFSPTGKAGYVKEVRHSQLTNEMLIGRVNQYIMGKVLGAHASPGVQIVSSAKTADEKTAALQLFSERLHPDTINLENLLDLVSDEADYASVERIGFGAMLALAGLIADDREPKNIVVSPDRAYSIDHETFPSATQAYFDLSLPASRAVMSFFDDGAIYKYRKPTFHERVLSESALVGEYRDAKFDAIEHLFLPDLKNGNVERVYVEFSQLDKAKILSLLSPAERSLLSEPVLQSTLRLMLSTVMKVRNILDKAGISYLDEISEVAGSSPGLGQS